MAMPQEQEPVFLPFSEKSRQLLTSARDEAIRLNDNYIGTVHILLGLVKKGTLANIPLLKDIDPNKIIEDIEYALGCDKDSPTEEPRLTLKSKKVIELAVTEAFKDGAKEVTPTHILVGIIREGEGIAAGTLRNFLKNPEKHIPILKGTAKAETPEVEPQSNPSS